MGALCLRAVDEVNFDGATLTPVNLHLYNLGTSGSAQLLNRFLRPLGMGVFHCGVEVYGCEWAYSDTADGAGDGVFCGRPRRCEGHSYSETVRMGKTFSSESEVMKLMHELKQEWTVKRYDTLKQNCCHFAELLCQRLGVGSIPAWVTNLPGAGKAIAVTSDHCTQITRQAMCCLPSPSGGTIIMADSCQLAPRARRREDAAVLRA